MGRGAAGPQYHELLPDIAFVANLAAGFDRAAALAGPPGAPFPVRRQVRTQLRLLQVSPFGLKYTLRRFGSERLRPYVGAGLDFAVTITHQDPVADESLEFRGGPPFDAPLIGGTVAQAPEAGCARVPDGTGQHRGRVSRRGRGGGPDRPAPVAELRLSLHVDRIG